MVFCFLASKLEEPVQLAVQLPKTADWCGSFREIQSAQQAEMFFAFMQVQVFAFL